MELDERIDLLTIFIQELRKISLWLSSPYIHKFRSSHSLIVEILPVTETSRTREIGFC
jgi:hypothetical protein